MRFFGWNDLTPSHSVTVLPVLLLRRARRARNTVLIEGHPCHDTIHFKLVVAARRIELRPQVVDKVRIGDLSICPAGCGARDALHKAEDLRAVHVQPVSVRYGGPNRRLAAWAREDDSSFFSHLLQVIRLRRIDVTLRWEAPIPADIQADRKALARTLEQTIRRSAAQG